MALFKAVILGAVAGIAVPCALRDLSGRFGTIVERTTVHHMIQGVHIYWNSLIFGLVAVAAWALFKAAESD